MQRIKHPLIKLLSIICLCLMLVLIAELIILYMTSSSAIGIVAKKPENIEALQTRALNPENFHAISNKPLFIEKRQPIKTVVTKPTAQPKAGRPTKQLKVQLVGVTLMKDEALAIVTDDKGKYHRLRLNDTLNNWVINKIDNKSIRFSNKGVNKTFMLEKKRPLLK